MKVYEYFDIVQHIRFISNVACVYIAYIQIIYYHSDLLCLIYLQKNFKKCSRNEKFEAEEFVTSEIVEFYCSEIFSWIECSDFVVKSWGLLWFVIVFVDLRTCVALMNVSRYSLGKTTTTTTIILCHHDLTIIGFYM